jgi:gliding motility-associated-like protein
VIGTALNTCTSIASATVATKVLPVPSASVTPRVCVNTKLVFVSQGGNYYYWQGPLSFSTTLQNYTLMANNVGMAGTYTLKVTDTAGCSAYAYTKVIIDASPMGNVLVDNKDNCVPFCSNYSLVPNISGSTFSEMNWSLGNESFSGSSFKYCFSTAGEYSIRGSFSDERSCKGSVLYVVNAYPVPVADFEYSPQKPVENQDEVVFSNTSKGIEQSQWTWLFVSDKGYKSQREQSSYTFKDAGVYAVALITKNKWGCADTIVKSIGIEEDFAVYVPNAFTPNEDNKNETFNAVTRGVTKYSLQIFSRWGQKVFESTDLNTGWDGTFKGQACKSDVYAWKISASTERGVIKELTGQVTLYR